MVYSEKWYIILYLFAKLIDNQYFIHFTTMCTIQAYFEPYFGNHKIRNSLMLKNMQKIFQGRTPPQNRGSRDPLTPCKLLTFNKLVTQY